MEKKFELSAEKHELENLAERFEVTDIKFLRVNYIIMEKPDILGAYVLVLEIKSEVTKFMIEGKEENISIDDKFDVILLDESMAKNNYEQLKDFDIEIFDEKMQVDVGEIASQYLSLCIFM